VSISLAMYLYFVLFCFACFDCLLTASGEIKMHIHINLTNFINRLTVYIAYCVRLKINYCVICDNIVRCHSLLLNFGRICNKTKQSECQVCRYLRGLALDHGPIGGFEKVRVVRRWGKE